MNLVCLLLLRRVLVGGLGDLCWLYWYLGSFAVNSVDWWFLLLQVWVFMTAMFIGFWFAWFWYVVLCARV